MSLTNLLLNSTILADIRAHSPDWRVQFLLAVLSLSIIVYILALDIWVTIYDMYTNGIQPISFIEVLPTKGSYVTRTFSTLSHEYWTDNVLLRAPSDRMERIIKNMGLAYYLWSALCAIIALLWTIYVILNLIIILIMYTWSSRAFRVYLLISVMLALLPINIMLGQTFDLFWLNYLAVFLIAMWPPKK